jgi:succinoglycan biosynthesis transport protein ExoP
VTSGQVLGLLVRRWRLVALFAVLGVAVALGLTLVVSPTYVVRSELFVSGAGQNVEERLRNGEYIRNRIASYAGLVTSPAVLEVVRDDLGIPADEEPVADSVTATNPLETALIHITVEDSSAERATAVSEQIGRVANSVIGQLETTEAGSSPANVTVVSPAIQPLRPESPSRKVYALTGLVVGTALGVGAGFLRDVRAQRRGSPADEVQRAPAVRAPGSRHAHEVGALPTQGTGPP